MATPFPRRLFLPPPGRPRWMPPTSQGWDLLYLSWGQRWFGDSPIPAAMHDGWVYVVILEGTPLLLIGDISHKMHPGTAILIHPDCAFGWTDRPTRRCRVLTWLWRSAPSHPALQPPPATIKTFTLDRPALRRLTSVHSDCVREVAFPDDLVNLSLRRARLELDVCLARLLQGRPAPDPRYRMKLATEFLRSNIAARQPVQRLCEYLQISPTALKRLFHTQSGQSPKQYVLQLRMDAARHKLQHDHLPVKRVA